MALTETVDTLDTKLKQLKLAMNRTESIVAQRNLGAVEQHLSALKVLTTEANQCKRVVKKIKHCCQRKPQRAKKRIFQVDTKIFEADESVKNLKTAFEEFHQDAELKKQQKELDSKKGISKQKWSTKQSYNLQKLKQKRNMKKKPAYSQWIYVQPWSFSEIAQAQYFTFQWDLWSLA